MKATSDGNWPTIEASGKRIAAANSASNTTSETESVKVTNISMLILLCSP